MSLESLTNPLERLQYLPTAMQMRPSDFPPSSSYVYSALIQYFLNDVAFSAVDDAAYVYTGGADQDTSTLGGADPSANPSWTLLGGAKTTKQIPTSGGAALGALTLTNHTLAVPANSKWLVSVHGVAAKGSALAASDAMVLGVTSSGTGGVGSSSIHTGAVGASPATTSFNVASTFYVEAGTTTSTLTITATVLGNASTMNLTNIVAAYTRLA